MSLVFWNSLTFVFCSVYQSAAKIMCPVANPTNVSFPIAFFLPLKGIIIPFVGDFEKLYLLARKV